MISQGFHRYHTGPVIAQFIHSWCLHFTSTFTPNQDLGNELGRWTCQTPQRLMVAYTMWLVNLQSCVLSPINRLIISHSRFETSRRHGGFREEGLEQNQRKEGGSTPVCWHGMAASNILGILISLSEWDLVHWTGAKDFIKVSLLDIFMHIATWLPFVSNHRQSGMLVWYSSGFYRYLVISISFKALMMHPEIDFPGYSWSLSQPETQSFFAKIISLICLPGQIRWSRQPGVSLALWGRGQMWYRSPMTHIPYFFVISLFLEKDGIVLWLELCNLVIVRSTYGGR